MNWTIVFGIAVTGIILAQVSRKSESSAPSAAIESLRKLACNSALIDDVPHCTGLAMNQKIAIGFAGCIDIMTRAPSIFELLEEPESAAYFTTITNEQELAATLAYLYTEGAAAEFKVPLGIFRKILEHIRGSPRVTSGNAAAMAKRLAWEGIPVQLISPLAEELHSEFPNTEFLSPLVEDPDYHIVVEYKEGEKWGKFTAARSNRFYMNADKHNTDPAVLKAYRQIGAEHRVVVIGGLQLVQDSQDFKPFLSELQETLVFLNAEHKAIHVELGDFHRNDYYRAMLEQVKRTHSLGMNEQELGKLLYTLQGKKFRGYDVKPELSQLLNDLLTLLGELKVSGFATNRVHLHTISAQIICSTAAWGHPLIPASRASLISNQYACATTDIQASYSKFYSGNFTVHGQAFSFNEENLHKCWESSGFSCCAVLVPTCTSVVRVTSLGDNVSAMGLGYHELSAI